MTRLGVVALDTLARYWPSPVAASTARLGGAPGTPAYEWNYTIDQYMSRVWFGASTGRTMPPLWGKSVLEIGCGHGGITCYLASLGARRAIGIDLKDDQFRYGRRLQAHIAESSGARRLGVNFLGMDCHRLGFREASFDVVLADNLVEHVRDPQAVMEEAFRVLRPGGLFLVPNFSSIFSKYGLHLKHGLKLPWANLFFGEEVIVEAMRRQARRRPELLLIYPGLGNGATRRVRELRRHHDLNDITYSRFLATARRIGFVVEDFHVQATRLGRIVRRALPALRASRLLDVLSTGARATLRKPGGAAP